MATDDLGFKLRKRKNGAVDVLHHGRVAATLRGTEGLAFLEQIEQAGGAGGQHLMARLTGNYKRGNERTASAHPRNRR